MSRSHPILYYPTRLTQKAYFPNPSAARFSAMNGK